MIKAKEYITRKIVRNPSDNSGFMALKLSESGDFNRRGSPYNKRTLYSLLKGIKSDYEKNRITGYTLVLDNQLSKSSEETFDSSEKKTDSNETGVDRLIEALGLRQGVEARV